MRLIVVMVVWCVLGCVAIGAPDPTVEAAKTYPSWEVRGSERVAAGALYRLRLASQRWRSEAEVDRPEWTHNVVIAVPAERRSERVLLVISGGRFSEEASERSVEQVVGYALQSGLAVALVDNVPAQPLVFAGDDAKPLWEDALLSESWVRYLRSDDAEWIAHKAMVLAARAAMSAVEEQLRAEGHEVDGFTLLGGSKRGWTVWLTALEDERVKAAIPAVIPLLNMKPHFEHHKAAYGFWAPTLKDYEERGLLERVGAADFGRIARHVDPYERREGLGLPKFIVNAAGDEFFLPDSDQFYVEELPGHTSLLVKAGAGHSVTRAAGVTESILAWAVTEATVGVDALPTVKARRDGERLVVEMSREPIGVVHAWMSNEGARDFRVPTVGSEWAMESVEAGMRVEVELARPEAGWRAHVVEVTFETPSGLKLLVSTPVYVLGVKE